MTWRHNLRAPGVMAALGAALLFGAGTPFAKGLLSEVSPWLLAGLHFARTSTGVSHWVWSQLSMSTTRRLRKSLTAQLMRAVRVPLGT